MTDNEKRWTDEIREALAGRMIRKVRYMTVKEAEDWGWYKRPIIIELDNGTQLIPSMDDEGNDGGAIFTNLKNLNVIPVFGLKSDY